MWLPGLSVGELTWLQLLSRAITLSYVINFIYAIYCMCDETVKRHCSHPGSWKHVTLLLLINYPALRRCSSHQNSACVSRFTIQPFVKIK